MGSTEGVEKVVPRQHAPAGLDQGRQEPELDEGEVQHLAAASHLVAFEVDLQVGVAEHSLSAGDAPQNGLHASDQFGGCERLDEVVVGTLGEALEPVAQRAAS